MEVAFFEEGHRYISTNEDNIDWVSVSSLTKQFSEPFIAALQAEKSTKNKKSKWYGIPADEIVGIWESEALRSTDLGTWYHNKKEKKTLSCEYIEAYGLQLPVVHPIWDGNKKIAPVQKLENGVYPEHMVYLKTEGICGQSDEVTIANKRIYVDDWKTNKEIKEESFRNWEGQSKRLNRPLQHLDDCNKIIYDLQLSIYATAVKRHNPLLEVTDLTLHHILFEEEGRDKYDNPITRLDENGEPIVKDIIKKPCVYYKDEVEKIFQWLKINRNNLRKK